MMPSLEHSNTDHRARQIVDLVCNRDSASSRIQALQQENLLLRMAVHESQRRYDALRNEYAVMERFSMRMCEQRSKEWDALEAELERAHAQGIALQETVSRLQGELLKRRAEAAEDAFLRELTSLPCPISLAPMSEPVDINCGHVFERRCIERWLQIRPQCPECACAFDRSECYAARSSAMNTVIGSVAALQALRAEVVRSIRSEFLCPVAGGLLTDPVVAPCGHLVEKGARCARCAETKGSTRRLPPYLRKVLELLKQSE
jgi:hypothetical protein